METIRAASEAVQEAQEALQEARAQRRAIVLQAVQDGVSIAACARVAGVGRDTVHAWINDSK